MFSYLQEIYLPLFCRLHLYGELAGVLFSGGMLPIHIDCFTISLHSPKAADRAVKGDCLWPLKNHGNSHQSHERKTHYNTDNPNLHVDQPITKGWCQQRSCDVSYHIVSPNAARLRLWSSLQPYVWRHSVQQTTAYWRAFKGLNWQELMF